MKRIFLLLTLALTAAGTGFAQTRTVSIPDTTGIPGTVLRLPVSVAGIIASDGVTSSQFIFTFPDSQFEWVGVSLQGSLLEETGSVQSNAQLKRVALASTDSISSNGVLFYLDLRVKQHASRYSTFAITFASAQLNEGVPTLTTDNGSIRVKGMSLQPGFVNNLLLTDTLALSLTGDGQAPYGWSVSNNSIATIDANGVLRPQALGFVRVLVTDSQGLRDSTNMIRIQPAALANLTISMPDTTTRQTRMLRMPVRTTDLTGIGATSFETVVTYPTNAFTYLGLDTVGTNIGGGPLPVVHQTTNQIRIAYASDTPLSGSGDLFAIRFQVSPTYQGGATISFSEARFNEDLIPALDNSSVNILASPTIIISPDPLHTTPGRSIDIAVSGGTPPYTFKVETPGIVTISNGRLTGIAPGITRISVGDDADYESSWARVQVFNIEARIPDTTVVFPDTMRLPIRVEPLNGLGIQSIEAIVRYDTTLFQWLGVQPTTMTEGMTIESERIGSDIKVAFAGTHDLSGEGDVILLSFIPRSQIGNMVRMPVSLIRFRFNEASDSTATAQLFNGGITNDWGYTAPGVPIALTAEPEPGTAIVIRLNWMAPDDDGGQPVTDYSIEYRETGSGSWLSFADGVSSTTTALVTGLSDGTYDFRVAARNAIGLGGYTTPVSATDIQIMDAPLETDLLGNFPNPFNPSTVIRYQLSVSGNVRLAVYDVLGRQVAVLADGNVPAGSHQIRFDAANLASGVYVYRLEAGGRVFTRTLLLVK